MERGREGQNKGLTISLAAFYLNQSHSPDLPYCLPIIPSQSFRFINSSLPRPSPRPDHVPSLPQHPILIPFALLVFHSVSVPSSSLSLSLRPPPTLRSRSISLPQHPASLPHQSHYSPLPQCYHPFFILNLPCSHSHFLSDLPHAKIKFHLSSPASSITSPPVGETRTMPIRSCVSWLSLESFCLVMSLLRVVLLSILAQVALGHS